jgi:GNAT superfamily N-acetyltransferase
MSRYGTPRPVTVDDELGEFDSGEPSLDEWLRKRALTNHAAGASRTFVTTREGRVVGYYALATGAVHRIDATRRVGHGMPDPVPVVLLGRLAADRKEQGHGLGSHLLRDAILRTIQVAEQVAVRAMLVHALNDAARQFYLQFDFEPSPTDDLHLLLLVKDARAAVTGK